MRITLELLQKYTAQYVAQRTRQEHGLVCVFLTGSVAEGDALWCDVPDIDLVFVHNFPPETPREIVSLLDDVHLDIRHHDRQRYEPARQIRVDAALGPAVYAARPLHDPLHFFDFVQASVRSQYDRAEYVYRRAAPLLEEARRMWFALREESFSPEFLEKYLNAVESAARSLSVLADVSLTSRRFALLYRRAVTSLGREELFSGFLGMLGGNAVGKEAMAAWLSPWEAAWKKVAASADAPVWSAPRLAYFRSGIQTLLGGEMPQMALWPLLATWTRLARLGADTAGWEAACRALGLTVSQERVAALDAYLDTAEGVLSRWGHQNGVA